MFRVLGPLECTMRGRVQKLGGAKKRALLGILLLNVNQVVPASRITEAVWPEGPPRTSRNIMQNMVWSLRRMLGPMLLTQRPGYSLRAGPGVVDLSVFRAYAAEGVAALADGQADSAAEHLRAALGLWRGPALVDLTELGYHWPELVALETARLRAYEDYIDAELARDAAKDVIDALEELVAAHPLRERLCGQLMITLYRLGCPADALAVYRRARSVIVDELGIEPGTELQRLEQAILARDERVLTSPRGSRPTMGSRTRTSPSSADNRDR
ncbi:hypothetical protein Lesp02_62120 [Lentzea sp. NBRC 105346]|uniref:AfsR/SARP family transcriptional regulator n=1 Tax=Lentzea sp. NBRC 105346 TaxID=3032205 RepID=UPI002555F0B7|nr:AfsR/SARP family transcriptional regulator [Lentzea sp. NBRC 105346]GLZ34025.1 hypothetical protein Lesp02_62120 [Lentzea sp. NBRC 105346]